MVLLLNISYEKGNTKKRHAVGLQACYLCKQWADQLCAIYVKAVLILVLTFAVTPFYCKKTFS